MEKEIREALVAKQKHLESIDGLNMGPETVMWRCGVYPDTCVDQWLLICTRITKERGIIDSAVFGNAATLKEMTNKIWSSI